MPKVIDQTGKRFGKLVVLRLAGKKRNDKTVMVRCDCGIEREMVQSKLTRSTKPSRSCGCASQENHWFTHNLTNHPWYSIWRSMRGRCYNTKNGSYSRYGGRGITVCDEWRNSPELFIRWLDQNGYRKGLQVDRSDNDGEYSPSNCRIATHKQNANNRRDTVKLTMFGREYTISEASEVSGRKHATIYMRLRRGLSGIESVFGDIRKSPVSQQDILQGG